MLILEARISLNYTKRVLYSKMSWGSLWLSNRNDCLTPEMSTRHQTLNMPRLVIHRSCTNLWSMEGFIPECIKSNHIWARAQIISRAALQQNLGIGLVPAHILCRTRNDLDPGFLLSPRQALFQFLIFIHGLVQSEK